MLEGAGLSRQGLQTDDDKRDEDDRLDVEAEDRAAREQGKEDEVSSKQGPQDRTWAFIRDASLREVQRCIGQA